MRKMTRSAFTLVELIVVITILAILATVAFISFGGQTSKAKNAKITSDLSSIASKVNVMTLNAGKTVTNFQGTENSNYELTAGTGAGLSLATTDHGTNSYKAGKINFFELQEKEENFKDTSTDPSRDYIYASAAKDTVAVFNVAGQTTDEAGNGTPVIKGSYYKSASTDVESLIASSGSTTQEVVNGSGSTLLY